MKPWSHVHRVVHHWPLTLGYIAAVVTVILVLQIVEVVAR